MLVRKKPVEVHAELFDGSMDRAMTLARVVKGQAGLYAGQQEQPDRAERELWYIEIPTLEGTMRADAGDWIIKGVQGEFYPCKPAVFHRTYDIVDVDDDEMVRFA